VNYLPGERAKVRVSSRNYFTMVGYRVVQQVEPGLEALGFKAFQLFTLSYDQPLSTFAFNCNSRPYNTPTLAYNRARNLSPCAMVLPFSIIVAAKLYIQNKVGQCRFTLL